MNYDSGGNGERENIESDMMLLLDDILTQWWETEAEDPVSACSSITIKNLCHQMNCSRKELFNAFREYLRYNLQFPDRDLVVFSTFFGEGYEKKSS